MLSLTTYPSSFTVPVCLCSSTSLTFHPPSGDAKGLCSIQYWGAVRTLDVTGCNVKPSVPISVTVPVAGSTLQNGHTYYITLRATSGAGVTAVSPSAPFVFINSLPNVGHVFEVSVQAGPISIEQVDVDDDIDFQSDTCCMLAQWTLFTHAYDQSSVTYTVALLYDGQVLFSTL